MQSQSQSQSSAEVSSEFDWCMATNNSLTCVAIANDNTIVNEKSKSIKKLI